MSLEKFNLKDQEGIRAEDILAVNRDVQFCTDIGQFRAIIQAVIKVWNDTHTSPTLLVSVDGLSGSGKSMCATNIQTIVDQLGTAKLQLLPIDLFIATERDDPLRVRMTESAELFWRFVYTRSEILSVIHRIVRAQGRGVTLPMEQLYDRPSGKLKPGSIEAPPGRKVILVDGIDSTRLLLALQEQGVDCPQYRILYYVRPEVALRRAVQRDTTQGRRTLEENREYRVREYQYLVPQILNENVKHADLIYFEQG